MNTLSYLLTYLLYVRYELTRQRPRPDFLAVQSSEQTKFLEDVAVY